METFNVEPKPADYAKFIADLVAVQSKMQNPKRDGEVRVQTKAGGVYSYKYATLDQILDMARPILAEHGMALHFQQTADVEHPQVVDILCKLLHHTGHSISSRIRLPSASTDPKSIGALKTYARRYTVQDVLAITAEEDKDAAPADHKPAKKAEREPSGEATTTQCRFVSCKRSSGTKGDKPWTRFAFNTPEGDRYTTFSSTVAKQIQDAGSNATWIVEYTKSQYGRDIVAVSQVGAEGPPEEGEEDALPF